MITCPFRTVCTGYDATNVFVVLPSQEASCGVTINEISGQELSMTTSQTDNISWLFEVSVNVSVSVCVVEKGKEGSGEGVVQSVPTTCSDVTVISQQLWKSHEPIALNLQCTGFVPRSELSLTMCMYYTVGTVLNV